MYKMQNGKQYYGRITINPKPGVKTGLNFIRSWFKTKFHGDETVTILSADAATWSSGTLQESVPGTVPLAAMVQESDPRGATVWFRGQWVGAETDPAQIQKDHHSLKEKNASGFWVDSGKNVEYMIHDMIEVESGNWIIKDGVVQEEVLYLIPGPEEAKAPVLMIPKLAVPELWLEEGRWYKGAIKANSDNVSVDNALQSLGFYGSNVNQTLTKGQTATFEGEWKRTTGNYLLQTAQYQIAAVQPVQKNIGPLPDRKPQKESETWQPSERMSPLKPEYEDTGHRREYEERATQEDESGSSNTALWILGILGVSVAGYFALKGSK